MTQYNIDFRIPLIVSRNVAVCFLFVNYYFINFALSVLGISIKRQHIEAVTLVYINECQERTSTK